MKTARLARGFTLIELMVVVAIIAILAAIAVPQYQAFIVRSQFGEAITIADGLKTPVMDYFNQAGQCPALGTAGAALASAGASYAGKYVATVTTGTGAAAIAAGVAPCGILVTFKSTVGSIAQPLKGQTVTFTGTDNGGSFSWRCTAAAAIPTKYVPTACR